MFSKSHNIDKYILPNFINIQTAIVLISTNECSKNIINNCDKLEKNDNLKMDKIYATMIYQKMKYHLNLK